MFTTIAIRMPPRTFRATSTAVSTSPNANTAVGQDAIEPLMPSPTGTVVFAASGNRRTNPASTRPTKLMNRPMPTAIAAFNAGGTASNTALRNPVATRTRITMPSTTTRPIASGQLTCWAIVTASSVLIPSPAAIANGKFATSPNSTVITPATSAVLAATCGTVRMLPSTSRFAVGESGE